MEVSAVRGLVTGGTSGLGYATARALLGSGARVAILGRDGERGQKAARALGPAALFVQADIVDPDSVQAGLDRIAGAFGCLNLLVNCAGSGDIARVLGRYGPADLAAFARVVEVNLVGTFNCIRMAAALMSRAAPTEPDGERGVIINTASIAAYEAQVGQAAYAASKGGIVAMTLPLARELAEHGIRVITIAPGLFETPMLMPFPRAVRDSLRRQIPFPRRLGKPEEYASLVLHVIENTMLNGETIRLDGALRMQAV